MPKWPVFFRLTDPLAISWITNGNLALLGKKGKSLLQEVILQGLLLIMIPRHRIKITPD